MSEDKHASRFEKIGNLDKTIHEPARLMILLCLYVVESVDFTFLLNQLGVTQGNLSFHLLKLEKAEYVDIKKEFVGKMPHTMISLTKLGRERLEKYKNDLIDSLGLMK